MGKYIFLSLLSLIMIYAENNVTSIEDELANKLFKKAFGEKLQNKKKRHFIYL